MADQQRGAGQPTWPLDPYAINVQYGASRGIARGTGADWFGPLDPMAPTAPSDVAGRQLDFPVGYNLSLRPRQYETLGFEQLRAFAQDYDLLRVIIETRKDQVERLRWQINPRDPKFKRKSEKVPAEAQTRIDAITAFLRKPDGITPWKSWIRAVLEDLFVIDAPTLYCQRNRGGQLIALNYLDGAHIKRVIDDWGRTPQPYPGPDDKIVFPPAYQHVLKGYPAVNYSVRDIIYRPRNIRSHKVYGYSPVEQVVMTVQIALRRQLWMLDYYTSGSVPDALIGTPDDWTPDQIKQYQTYFDQLLSGNLSDRRKVRFIPGGMAKNVHETREPEQKNDFDEWLARIICFAFSVSPSWAVKMMNRSSGEKQSDQADEEGIEPTKEWIKELIDGIIEDEFNSPDLELAWADAGEVDPQKNEAILEGRVKLGGISINTWRDALGLDPDPNPAADQLMVYTPTGYVPIEANTIDGKQANIDAFGMPPAPGAPQGQNNAEGDKKTPQGKGSQDGEVGKAAAVPFVKRRRAQAPSVERLRARASRNRLTKAVAAGLRRLGKDVASQVSEELAKERKSPKRRAKEIADAVDLSALDDLIGSAEDAIEEVASDAASDVLAQLGVDADSDLVDQVNARAVEWAQNRAAEMVGRTYDEDGNLIDAVRAEYRIDQSTRDALQDIIANGLDENIGVDEIIDNIKDSFAFSDDRADLIARTEITRANSQGALLGAKGMADDTGLKLKKAWLTAGDDLVDEDICQPNEDQGDIELDDDFDSGDDAPPGHPRCRCVVIFEEA